MNDYDYASTAIGGVFLFILAIFVITILAGESHQHGYIDRIETKYNITVVDDKSESQGNYVIYRDEDGDLCTANKGQNDLLIETGCEAED